MRLELNSPGTSHGPTLTLLLLLAVLTRFAFFGWPTSSIIDEIYLANYFSSYFTHQFYMDVHPPLAKLIVAGFASLLDFEPVLFGTHWKQEYADYNYLILRFPPALFGVLLVAVVYALTFALWKNRGLAFFIGLLVVLENALVTQSRSLFWENFLLVFGFASTLFYVRYREDRRWVNLALTGLFAGAAVSVKWIALSFVALPMLMDGLDFLTRRIGWRALSLTVAAMLGTALLVYASAFYLHFSLLPLSGKGDPFMSRAFQSGLAGSKYASEPLEQKLTFVQKFVELNQEMYRTNQRMRDHPFGSRWYQWPLARKAVGYWHEGDLHVRLQPNVAVWWAASLSVLALALMMMLGKVPRGDPVAWLILAGYLLNWLPFAAIGRVMFIHSYFSAFLFSLLAMALIVTRMPSHRVLQGWMIVAALLAFLATSHLTYGLPPMFWSWKLV